MSHKRPPGDRFGILGRWADRLLAAGDPELRGARGALVRLARIFYFAYREFLKKLCWERAAALAFDTVICLIPLAVLFLSFVGMFWSDEELRGFLESRLLAFLVPDPKTRGELWQPLASEIKTADFKLRTGANLIAFGGLVVAAAALLVSAERVFNRLWEVTNPRSYFQKLRIFWIVLTVSPLALGVSLSIEQLTAAGSRLGELKASYRLLDALYSFCIPALVAFVGFTILNTFLPNTRVRLVPALLGSLVAGALWEGAKRGFYLYVREATNLSRFYGSLGVIPVFLLWVYISWLITLFGAVVTRSAQNLSQFTRLAREKRQPSPVPGAFLSLYLLERIHAAFLAGRPSPPLIEIAEPLGLGVEVFEAAAGRLVQAGMIVEDAQARGRYAPARPAGSLRLREVVESAPEPVLRLEGLSAAVGNLDGARRILDLLLGSRTAFLDRLGEMTVESLIVKP